MTLIEHNPDVKDEVIINGLGPELQIEPGDTITHRGQTREVLSRSPDRRSLVLGPVEKKSK